jgi:ATP-binding cassette subfamily C (CFTR/MRP) protein 1
VSGLAARDTRGPPSAHNSTNSRTGLNQVSTSNAAAKNRETAIIETERAEIGGVKWSVYIYYIKSVGYAATAVSVSFFALFQILAVSSNIWLSRWTDDPRAVTEPGVRNRYLAVYGLLGLLKSITIMVATAVIFVFTLDAAVKLHRSMLLRIMKSTMSFFDTTPLGRILNRFAKDIDNVDTTIPLFVQMTIYQVLVVIGTLVAIIFAMPIFILVVIPVVMLFYFLQKFYVATARQVKRMEAISRSPIYTHFSETITGSSTIRAFGRSESFIMENEEKVDENQACYYPILVATYWLTTRLELIGNLLIMFACLFAVISRGSIEPGLVGLSLSYALNVTNALNRLVRMITEVETNMVAVERIQEYQAQFNNQLNLIEVLQYTWVYTIYTGPKTISLSSPQKFNFPPACKTPISDPHKPFSHLFLPLLYLFSSFNQFPFCLHFSSFSFLFFNFSHSFAKRNCPYFQIHPWLYIE